VIGFHECRHERRKKSGRTECGSQRYKCLKCGKRFTDSTGTLAGMRIGVDKSAQIISMLVEGLSIRAVARLSQTNPETILDLLLVVGKRCRYYMENVIANVPVKDVSVDELWAFVGMKERTRKILSRPAGTVGDCYTFVGWSETPALSSRTKLAAATVKTVGRLFANCNTPAPKIVSRSAVTAGGLTST
jgi:transposase-like protein